MGQTLEEFLSRQHRCRNVTQKTIVRKQDTIFHHPLALESQGLVRGTEEEEFDRDKGRYFFSNREAPIGEKVLALWGMKH